MSATTQIRDLFSSMFASVIASNDTAKSETKKVFGDVYKIRKTAADAMASTTSAENTTPWEYVHYSGNVYAVYVHPTAALTGDPTNNAVLTLSSRDASGATQTTVATLTTTASWVAGTPVAMTLTAANVAIVAGGSLTLTIAKGGTGVVVPISSIVIFAERT
jgi:hypothetical protein